MDGYIRASEFVLYPYVFVVDPNKLDCSRRTRLRGNFCQWSASSAKGKWVAVYYTELDGTQS